MRPRWSTGPATITLVRHGLSLGNQADQQARHAGAEQLDLDTRDADVELSDTGYAQADGLATWLAEQGSPSEKWVVISSPYRRAADSAERAMAGLGLELEYDERLRERDLGTLDGLTGAGIRARHPEEAARRSRIGKFYYQPPSGESWADVVARVRSLLQDLREGYEDAHVWMFSHQAVIMSFRYVLEDLSEAEILDLDRKAPIPNLSVTTYRRTGPFFELERFADTTAVDRVGADVTAEPAQAGRASVRE